MSETTRSLRLPVLTLAETLRSQLQKLLDLRGPITPIVRARKLTVFVRHAFLEKQRDKVAITLKQEIVGAAVDVQKRKVPDLLGCRLPYDLERIVRLTDLRISGSEDRVDR